MAEPEPWDGLVAGCRAYLEASLDPTTQRIALIDAPSVLGWDAWHAGFQHLFGLLAIGLHWAVAAGEIEDQPVVPLAHVLLGALNEGAMFIARSDDRGAARDGVAAAISQVLAGLRRTA
jgi:hypothetical protein